VLRAAAEHSQKLALRGGDPPFGPGIPETGITKRISGLASGIGNSISTKGAGPSQCARKGRFDNPVGEKYKIFRMIEWHFFMSFRRPVLDFPKEFCARRRALFLVLTTEFRHHRAWMGRKAGIIVFSQIQNADRVSPIFRTKISEPLPMVESLQLPANGFMNNSNEVGVACPE